LECLIVAPNDLARMQAELPGLDINSQHATAGTALMSAAAAREYRSGATFSQAWCRSQCRTPQSSTYPSAFSVW
jgi:hypothetical protein